MTPNQLAKTNSEAAHQTALFAFCAIACKYGFNVAWSWSDNGDLNVAKEMSDHDEVLKVPELRWLHHIPNGGSRGDTEKSRAIEGGKLKSQGVKRGVLDIMLPVRRNGFCGLYIEMKKPGAEKSKNGGLTDEQIEFGRFVIAQGYKCELCYSWRQAAEVIEKYLQSV